VPELWSESQIESFMRQGFDSGATLDQMKSYLVTNGYVQGQQTVPAEPEVSSFRQRLEERVQAGEAAGGLRTAPAPGEEELPPAPEVGFEKLEAAALGTVLPYLQLADLQQEHPLLTSTPYSTLGALIFSEGRRIAGLGPIAESPETRAVWEALRLAEEEVAPEGLLSSEGLQVLGLEILLDPMNALPGVGFSDVPGRVFTATGRRLLGKGLLGPDEFAKAWSGGLSDEVWNETSRMMEAAQRAVVADNLLQVRTEATRGAKETVEQAIKVTRERYADEIADTANEYFESLEQRDLFRKEKQAEFGFVEADPRLAFDDVAQVPSRLADDPLPELTISAREALRAKLDKAFPNAGKKQIQEMLDESTKVGTQMAEDAVEPGPPLPGRTPEGLRKRLKEAFPQWSDDQVDLTVESAIEESQRVIQHSPGLEIPGRVGPPQTMYDTRDVLLKGFERQLADLNIMERAHTALMKDDLSSLVDNLDLSAASKIRDRISKKANESIERGIVSGDINKMARDAIERTYKVAIDRPTPPSRNMARLLARVGQKNFEEIAGRLSEAVPPAEMEKMGVMDRLLWRAGYRFLGGESAEFMEGSLRAVAREYTDPGVKDLLTKTWPRLYTSHRGRVAQRMFSAREAGGKVSREVRRVASESGQSLETIGRQLNKARTDGNLTEIADSGLRTVVREATDLIDGMSEEFISGGLIPDTEIEKFRENMGKYLHMNYATFNVANWKKNVRDTAIWENAFDWFKRQYPEMTDAEITGSMMYMLSNRKKLRVGKGAEPLINSLPGNLPKQVLDELKLKRDLPDELRELLGVNKDFLANFDITAGKMIHDLEVTRLHRQMLKTGLRHGVLRVSKDLTTPTEVRFDRIWNRPVYADEPLANALGVMEGMLNDKRNIIGILNGITKGMKIIPSPGTQMRNALRWPNQGPGT
jgi:hypothetical protein